MVADSIVFEGIRTYDAFSSIQGQRSWIITHCSSHKTQHNQTHSTEPQTSFSAKGYISMEMHFEHNTNFNNKIVSLNRQTILSNFDMPRIIICAEKIYTDHRYLF